MAAVGEAKKKRKMGCSGRVALIILTVGWMVRVSNGEGGECSEEFMKLVEKKNMPECKRLRTLGAQFGWRYEYSVRNKSMRTVVDIMFGAPLKFQEGWIAWGVNPGKRAEMVGTRAMVFLKRRNGTWRIDTYNVTKETRNRCILLPSNITLFSNVSIQAEVSNMYTMYARLTLPSDSYNISKLNHVWQVGDAIEEDHPLSHPTTLRNVDSTEVIDLTRTKGPGTGQYRSYLRSVHGVLNIIGWGTLLPIGIIIARYFRVFPFKCDPMWFYLHIGCQLTGFLVGTTGWAIGLSLGHSSRYYTFQAHRTYGILIFTFSTVQMLAFRLKPKETDDYRKYWNMYHHFLGYGLLAIIFLNIFKGINILEGGDAWKWGYIANLALLGAIAFGLEVFTWIHFIAQKQKQKQKQKEDEKTKHTDTSEPQTKHKPLHSIQPIRCLN
ncbi:hypothetical protein VNO78_31988 [Psophocarpus tetragonolobus]|uniref:Cytochrome b561 and DOMON domain-containing protein n=1 Tax=Psophocarpus tetragonolobus TaxID=3891 RepID=A0AAN9S167_PSOTE